MAHYKINQIHAALMNSRKSYRAYQLKRIQIVNVCAANTKGYQVKKAIHTTHWGNQREPNRDDDDEYELDLITMTKRKKQKKPLEYPLSYKGNDSSNVRSDDHIAKKAKKFNHFLNSEDVRLDDDLMSLSAKQWKKLRARAKKSSDLFPLFENFKNNFTSSGIADQSKIMNNRFSNFSKEQISKYDEHIKGNLTQLLNQAFDKLENSNAKKSRASTLLNIVSSTIGTKSSQPSKPRSQGTTSEGKNGNVIQDIKVDDDLVSPKSSSSDIQKDASDPKSDSHLVNDNSGHSTQSAGQTSDVRADNYLFIKEDGDLNDSSVDMFSPSSDIPQLQNSGNITFKDTSNAKSDDDLAGFIGHKHDGDEGKTSDVRVDDHLSIKHVPDASTTSKTSFSSDPKSDGSLIFNEEGHIKDQSDDFFAPYSGPRIKKSLFTPKKGDVRSNDDLINRDTATAGQTANSRSDDELIINESGDLKNLSEDLFAPYIRSDIEQLTKPLSTARHDEQLIGSSDPKCDEHLGSTRSNEARYNTEPTTGVREDDHLMGLKDDEHLETILNYDTSSGDIEPRSSKDSLFKVSKSTAADVEAQDVTKKPIEDSSHISNLFIPEVNEEEETPSGIRYNTSEPDINELNEIFNVSKPALFPTSEVKRVRKKNKALLSELGHLTPHEKIGRIGDIIELLEHEIPKLSREKNFSESEIREKSKKTQELRQRLEKLNQIEPEKLENLKIPLESLEGFLENAKKTQDLKEEEKFREAKAYEFSKAMTDKNSRTFQKHNFFTPIDESLSKRITSSPSSIKIPEQAKPDELFFPSLKPQANLTHEFMVLTNNKKIVTSENPLGDDYHPQDLFTIFRSLGNPEKYLKQINKLEKNGGWKLIGSGGDTNKILIFERFVDKEQEKKDLRKQRFRRFGWSFTTVFVLLYGFGSYFEHEQKVKYKIDQSGRAIKSY